MSRRAATVCMCILAFLGNGVGHDMGAVQRLDVRAIAWRGVLRRSFWLLSVEDAYAWRR